MSLSTKCFSCGSKLVFNSDSQTWNCVSCNCKFTLENLKKNINNVSEQVLSDDTISDIKIYICSNCNVEIMTEKITSGNVCVYCGGKLSLKEKFTNRISNYIIPFKTSKVDAMNEFKRVIKNKFLIPKIFKTKDNIDKISGIYIPFWLYDLEVNGEVEFEINDIKFRNDSKYKYKKVSRYSVRKNGHFDFLNILVAASSRFSDDLINFLEPYNYKELVYYNHVYLSDFFAEKNDISEMEGLKKAVEKINNISVDLLQKSDSNSEQKVINNGLRVSSRNVHNIMVPVWLLNITYNNKVYTFAMNGQTGKIYVNIPVGIKETIICFVVFFVILFTIGLIFVYMFL